MSLLIVLPLLLASLMVALLTAVFVVEVLAAFMKPRTPEPVDPGPVARLPLAVVIPAHDEGAALLPTIADAKAQLSPGDRLLVVADNCNDDTAAIARAAGAKVIERHDATRRGKGFALDFALKHLSHSPPHCVIFIDADCRISPGAIDALALACERERRPVQALYLMEAPSGLEQEFSLPVFAWRVKNLVRTLGMRNLNGPCQLAGAGMAVPWTALQDVNLASGHVVEDLKLGLDLTAAGHPPLFLPGARVTSVFPTSTTGMQTQRERWEGGHLTMIRKVALPLIVKAIKERNVALLVLSLDMAVPPLTLLTMLCTLVLLLTAVAAVLGFSAAPLTVSAMSLAALALAIALCWTKVGRDILPLSAAATIGPFLRRKVNLYREFIKGGAPSEWARTDRTLTRQGAGHTRDKEPPASQGQE